MGFSEQKAARAFQFFRLLRRPDGDGEHYRCTLWQYECLRDVYGTVTDDGLRQYQIALILIAKKNGKSEFAAGNAAYLLGGDGNPDAQIYLAAASKRQTGNVFKPVARMVERTPLLSDEFRVLPSTHTIRSRKNPLFNYLETVSADGDKNDGFKTHGAVVDEMHRWRERKALELWAAIDGGRVSVKEPLIWVITTAGEMDESPLLWQYYEYAKAIERGDLPPDPRFYFRIYEAGTDDDEALPSTWRKANPSLEVESPAQRAAIEAAGLHPGFLKMQELEDLHHKGQYMPKAHADFKRLHLNLWGSKEQQESPFAMKSWRAQTEEIKPLLDRRCYGGLDLSTSIDLTSFTLHFPAEDDWCDVLSFSWMPAGRLKRLQQLGKVPYESWSEQIQKPRLTGSQCGVDPDDPFKVLFLTEGDAVDYRQVREFIVRCSKLFDLQMVGYDPKLAFESATWLEEQGIEVVPVSQSSTTMSEPTNKALGLVAAGKVRHDNNPLFTWALGCSRLKQLDDNLVRLKKPEREKDYKRIDPVAAWMNAVYCWLKFGEQGDTVTDPEMYVIR